MIKRLIYNIYDFFTFRQNFYYKKFEKFDLASIDFLKTYQIGMVTGNPLIKAKSWGEFYKLPITSKKDLPDSPSMGNYRQHETSGSTGQPRVIWVPKESWSRKDAIFTRSWARMGRKSTDWVLRLISGEPKYPFYDWLRNVKPMNYKTISQKHVDWVVKNKPFLIHGPGGAIRQLCELLISQGHENILKDIKIHWCSESSAGHKERLVPYVKEFHEQYGLAELPTVGAPDGYGNIQVVSEMGIIEILDDDGKEVRPGQEGYIVVTDFNNTITPIVRYRCGDRGKKEIYCNNKIGQSYEIIYNIIGRGVDFYDGPEVKKAIGWWVVAPISHTMGHLIEKWRCEINIKERRFYLFVKLKGKFDAQDEGYSSYKSWVLENVGLECKFVEILPEMDEKYDIYWKNKLVKVVVE